MNFNELYNCFKEDNKLSEDILQHFINYLADPNNSEVDLAALTVAWRHRGYTAEDLYYIVSYIREQYLDCVDVAFPILDCCGVGGDHSNSYNISTTVAFVLGAMGVPVAKHGGRSTTSQSGSIDFLEAAGLPCHTQSDEIIKSLSQHNLAFIASPALQSVLGRWKQACKKTQLFGQTGLIGTLTNPINIQYQLLGVPSFELGKLMIETLQMLGRQRAMVVYGEPQLDEISVCGMSHIWELNDGNIQYYRVHPSEYGMEEFYMEELRGGSSAWNAQLFQKFIKGVDYLPGIAESVYLNAAFALKMVGQVPSVVEGLGQVQEFQQKGNLLHFYKEFSETSEKKTS